MTAIVTAVPAAAAPRVEPEAAVELVSLVQQQMGRLIQEHEPEATTLPHVAYQLAGALKGLTDLRVLDAAEVARVRQAVRIGRRLDMADGFTRLNPTFGVRVDYWSIDPLPGGHEQQAAAQRRELELAMGERFARLLVPAQGGGAA